MRQMIGMAAALLVAGCAAGEPSAEARADGEARLAAELRDYAQSGPDVSCVNLRQLGGNRSAGEGAVIFDGTGGRLWVNRPSNGCPVLSSGRALQVRTPTGQLCRGDIAIVFDPVTGMEYGGCGLGEFTPYKRRRG